MTIYLLHDHYDNKHLNSVKEKMKVLGAPTVRAVFDGEVYGAVEGCHRIRAAKDLGLTPIIEEIQEGESAVIENDVLIILFIKIKNKHKVIYTYNIDNNWFEDMLMMLEMNYGPFDKEWIHEFGDWKLREKIEEVLKEN